VKNVQERKKMDFCFFVVVLLPTCWNDFSLFSNFGFRLDPLSDEEEKNIFL
jgi:hypothetical protein